MTVCLERLFDVTVGIPLIKNTVRSIIAVFFSDTWGTCVRAVSKE